MKRLLWFAACALVATIAVADERLSARILPTIGYTPRYLFVGAAQGTEQAVAVFAGFVQEYVEDGGQFLVGLELPESEEALVNRFLDAADDDVGAARRVMLATPFWQRPALRNDGRASAAMLQLLEYLRTERRAQGDAFASLICFQDKDDEASARRLLSVLGDHPGARLLTLAGTAHAMKRRSAAFSPLPSASPRSASLPSASLPPALLPPSPPEGAARRSPSMPAFFPAEDTFTVDVRTHGGEAWQCPPRGRCGIAAMAPPAGRQPPCDRCLVLDDTLENFDAIYSIATPATAARPASEMLTQR